MIGVDEVGRGSWAGPLLVVAARATSDLPGGVKDSKLLSKQQRQKLNKLILTSCHLGEGWVSPKEIDKLGLAGAMRLGVKRALRAIRADRNEEIIIDGRVNYAPARYTKVFCQAKADNLHGIVSAASIYAKVTRDRYMTTKVHDLFPEYGFNSHVGYGTARHKAAISQHGICEMHRLSYKPIRMIKGQLK